MKINLKAISDIKPYENNPRVNDNAVDAVAKSIEQFGFRQPIVVDSAGVIICGHTRFKAAVKLGIDKVPVHVADNLTEDQVKAYRIADNKTASLSTWDSDLLAGEIDHLLNSNFDVLSLGFDDSEIQSILGVPKEKADKSDIVDEAPEPQEKHVSSTGDMWLLGDHRLLCGDSTKSADVDRLMGDDRAALVATDPPYLVNYTGKDRPGGSGKDWSDKYREVDIPNAKVFFLAVFGNVKRVLAPKAPIYCWHAHKRCREIQQVWDDLGILDHLQIIWVKPTPLFGRVFWYFQHEPCLMGWLKGSMPEHDAADMSNTTVWEIGWEGNKKRSTDNVHPTQKPVELFARPMRRHTARGAVCFEPFSGSGSQIIAGEQESRRVRAMELSPAFVDVAVRRWESYTGQAAVLDGDGRSFADVSADRAAGVRAAE